MTKASCAVLIRLALILLWGLGNPWQIESSLADQHTIDRSLADTLYFEFNKDQRNKFEQAVKEKSTAWFKLGIRPGKDAGLLPIRAHLRGQGTLKYCHRKSFTIDMPGDQPWNLIPDTAANGYYLISMCQDKDYLRTATMLRLWKSAGLFPINFRYVELVIGQHSHGLYMLLEKPADVLPHKKPGLLGLLRRRFTPPTTVIEVKYSSSTETIAAGDYVNTFLNLDHLNSQQFADTIESRLNLDQFIRHLAMSSVLFNGDYVDEVWFLQIPDDNNPHGYHYEVMKWDPDDTLNHCHYGTTYAFQDPNGIAACAESELAKIVLGNPALYPRFVAEVDRLLQNELSVANVTAAFDQTVSDLKKHLTNTDIIKLMEQFHDGSDATPDLAGALVQIDQTRGELVTTFQQHHRILAHRVIEFQQGR